MQGLPAFADPNLLVGAEHFGDAGVYRLDEKMAIVQSLDFFPPIVDDPYVFGRIAAANALSDVYAIGATPKTALNIVGFPDDEVGLDVLGEILRGGAERVEAAEAVIVGGHSVRAAEITYGLSVTGVVDPARMMTNEAAAPGDVINVGPGNFAGAAIFKMVTIIGNSAMIIDEGNPFFGGEDAYARVEDFGSRLAAIA